MPDMTFVAPRIGKVIKNFQKKFLKEEKICKKILQFIFKLSQSSEIVLQLVRIYTDEKLKGLKGFSGYCIRV